MDKAAFEEVVWVELLSDPPELGLFDDERVELGRSLSHYHVERNEFGIGQSGLVLVGGPREGHSEALLTNVELLVHFVAFGIQGVLRWLAEG